MQTKLNQVSFFIAFFLTSLSWANLSYASGCHMHGHDHASHMAVMDLVDDGLETHTAIQNGSWSSASTWSGGIIPSSNARVRIPADINITFDLANSPEFKTLRLDGSLVFATSSSTQLNLETFVITPCGSLEIGTRDNPIKLPHNAKVRFKTDANINLTEDPKMISRGLVSMGKVSIFGQEKTSWTKAESIDSSQIVLAHDVSNWDSGDEIIIPGTKYRGGHTYGANFAGTYDELRSIQSISGKTIQLDSPLAFLQYHQSTRDDIKIPIGNLTRNIVFENSTGPETTPLRRAHMMFMHPETFIYYAKVHGLGRTVKGAMDLDDPGTNVDGSPGFGTNPRGRYSMHFHRVGAGDALMTPAQVMGNVATHSPGWCFVNHGSHVLIDDNVAYDCQGTAFVTEDGDEMGSFRRNLAVLSKGDWFGDYHGGYHQHDVKIGTGMHDFGRAGHGFWLQGRNVVVEDNASCGNSEASFIYFHRSHVIYPDIDPDTLLSPFGYEEGREFFTIDDVPLVHNKGNFSCGSYIGLRVIKANPFAPHIRNVIEGFTSFHDENAAFVEYTRYYTFKDMKLIGFDGTNPWVSGFKTGNVTRDMVFNNVEIEGYLKALSLNTNPEFPDFLGANEIDTPAGLPIAGDVLLIDVTVDGFPAPHGVSGYDPVLDWVLNGNQLVENRFAISPVPGQSFTLPNALNWKVSGSYQFFAEVSDSTTPWFSYPYIWYGDNLSRYLSEEGYYENSSGDKVIPLELWHGDRATGEAYQHKFLVTIPPSIGLDPGKNQGLYAEEPTPQLVVTNDSYQANVNTQLLVDAPGILSNDSGGEPRVHIPTSSRPQHGSVSLMTNGGFVYTPKTNFEGVDQFTYQVWNGYELSDNITVEIHVGETSCPSDINGDGYVNVDDIGAFVQLFLDGSMDADVNNDGVLNYDDIDYFVNNFISCD